MPGIPLDEAGHRHPHSGQPIQCNSGFQQTALNPLAQPVHKCFNRLDLPRFHHGSVYYLLRQIHQHQSYGPTANIHPHILFAFGHHA